MAAGPADQASGLEFKWNERVRTSLAAVVISRTKQDPRHPRCHIIAAFIAAPGSDKPRVRFHELVQEPG